MVPEDLWRGRLAQVLRSSAARTLVDAGVEVTVLEARDRIGGRPHTQEIAGVPVDRGEAWIHGGSNNPVNAVCREFGISFQEDPQEVELYMVEGAGRVTSGRSARELLDSLADEEVVAEALAALEVLLQGGDVPTPLAAHVTRWRSDECSRGSYLYLPVGASRQDICALAASEWEGRLLFAGEATDPGYLGSVRAATRSAGREVRRFGVATSLPRV